MKPTHARFLLALIGQISACDSFYINNPGNCIVNPSLCGTEMICNEKTTHCEPDFVLGQPNSGTVQNLIWGLNAPTGVLLVNDRGMGGQLKLIVADTKNNRILIWNRVPQTMEERSPPDVVLGQSDLFSTISNYGGISSKTTSVPSSISSDGQRLLVGDAGNARVLIWNSIPTTHYKPADALWGQVNFITRDLTPPPIPTPTNAINTQLFMTSSGELLLADANQRRTLYFPTPPTGPSITPSMVFGPASLTSPLTYNFYPTGVPAFDGQSLYVADAYNDKMTALAVPVAPNNFSLWSNATNYGGKCPSSGPTTDGCFTDPSGVALSSGDCVGDKCVWIVDRGNSRVIRYPIMGLLGKLVVGQKDSTLSIAKVPIDLNTMNAPNGISIADSRLAVSDAGNHRILLWNRLPTITGQAADVVIGQPNGGTGDINAPPTINGFQFDGTSAVTGDSQHLVIADTSFHRILIWNSIPNTIDIPPDVVLGQRDSTSGQINGGSDKASRSSLASPTGTHLENGHLVVADSANHRVLIWNQLPDRSNTPADIVIGQADFTSNDLKTPPSDSTLNRPGWVHLHGEHLFVADTGNNRVLRYSSVFSNTGAIASDLVLGQTAMDGNMANNGGVSAMSLRSPGSVVADETHLFVSDSGNNRVLIWNQFPAQNGAPADVVLGQSDLSFAATLVAGPSTLLLPAGLSISNSMLMVADRGNNRLLYWRTIPTVNGTPADGVFGQTDTRVSIQNNHMLAPIKRLNAPSGLWMTGERLFIADSGNSRIVATRRP